MAFQGRDEPDDFIINLDSSSEPSDSDSSDSDSDSSVMRPIPPAMRPIPDTVTRKRRRDAELLSDSDSSAMSAVVPVPPPSPRKRRRDAELWSDSDSSAMSAGGPPAMCTRQRRREAELLLESDSSAMSAVVPVPPASPRQRRSDAELWSDSDSSAMSAGGPPAMSTRQRRRDAEKALEEKLKLAETVEQLKDRIKKLEEENKNLSKETIGVIIEEEFLCCVCFLVLYDPVTLNCRHTMCRDCLKDWKKLKQDCPSCRTPISTEVRPLAIDCFIDRIGPLLGLEFFKERQDALFARDSPRSPSPPPFPIAGPSHGGEARGRSGGRYVTTSRGAVTVEGIPLPVLMPISNHHVPYIEPIPYPAPLPNRPRLLNPAPFPNPAPLPNPGPDPNPAPLPNPGPAPNPAPLPDQQPESLDGLIIDLTDWD